MKNNKNGGAGREESAFSDREIKAIKKAFPVDYWIYGTKWAVSKNKTMLWVCCKDKDEERVEKYVGEIEKIRKGLYYLHRSTRIDLGIAINWETTRTPFKTFKKLAETLRTDFLQLNPRYNNK